MLLLVLGARWRGLKGWGIGTLGFGELGIICRYRKWLGSPPFISHEVWPFCIFVTDVSLSLILSADD